MSHHGSWVTCQLVGGPRDGEEHNLAASLVPGDGPTRRPEISRPSKVNDAWLDRYRFDGDESADPYRFVYLGTTPRQGLREQRRAST